MKMMSIEVNECSIQRSQIFSFVHIVLRLIIAFSSHLACSFGNSQICFPSSFIVLYSLIGDDRPRTALCFNPVECLLNRLDYTPSFSKSDSKLS